MSGLRQGAWSMLAAASLLLPAEHALAQHQPESSPTREAPSSLGQGPREPEEGNAVFGVLFIAGAIAFLIFMAWVFSRIGDSGGKPTIES